MITEVQVNQHSRCTSMNKSRLSVQFYEFYLLLFGIALLEQRPTHLLMILIVQRLEYLNCLLPWPNHLRWYF